MSPRPGSQHLPRTLGLPDAVTIGLGSMLGAGVFVALSPAATAAGSALLVALAVAALVAYCNATSSARLAAVHPQSGGTYVYGRERLGPFWGHLAGWAFVVGKLASCAAMALAVGTYTWPGHERLVAVGVVAALTGVNYLGVQKSVRLTRAVVAVVLTVLALVVIVSLSDPDRDLGAAVPSGDVAIGGVLQGAALLFFAFAGYARIATLGGDVRSPRTTIPRAIAISLATTLTVYAVVTIAAVSVLGVDGLSTAPAPLADAMTQAGRPGLAPVVQVGTAVAAVGSLLALILGVSRTTYAMAADRHLPSTLAVVHPRFGVPHRAEVAVGLVVVLTVVTTDLRGAIGFSSFGVLVYYAIAHASAWRLDPTERRPPRLVLIVGLLGCLVLALSLPLTSVVTGAAVLATGALAYVVRVHVVRRLGAR
jgi:APA family basic amino acid/polyamine antiporter